MAFSHSKTPLALAAVVLLAASLGACRTTRGDVTGAITPPDDPRIRHPYVLADGTRSLDVFPTGPGHLDPRQAADLDAFLTEYRRYGRSGLVIDVPRGGQPGQAAAAERTAASVRRLVAENGVRGGISLSAYPVTDPSLAAPVRLSFRRMEAGVASKCGAWPEDLGTSNPRFNNTNNSNWNFGCATRSNFAAQVADPVDLVRGRPEGRIDTVRRTQVIDKLRQGNDPSTTWRQDDKNKVSSEAKTQ